MRRRALTLALAPAAALALALPAVAAKDDLVLVSRATGGAASLGNSGDPSVSGDGRLVAFASNASNLAGDDVDPVFDILVRDVAAGTTTLVSRAAGAAGAGGADDSAEPAISADGRVVAFSSLADNLSGGDDETVRNVFARDLATGTTALVSRATGPRGAGADGDSFDPAISADGRLVAFTSQATNLADDLAGSPDVFVRDLATGTTTLVSRAPGLAGAPGDDRSFQPALSADGRVVAFASEADNLSDDDAGFGDVFARDLAAGATVLVSRGSGLAGVAANGLSLEPAVSADGRHVAFASGALNLSDEDADPGGDVFVRDLVAATTALASRAPGAAGAAGDADAGRPAISADGRVVAFESSAANLSGDDADGVRDVFARDLAAATTALVSRASGPAGPGGTSDSGDPALSADGRFAAFASNADNLTTDDGDLLLNVYLRDLIGPPPGPAPPHAGGPGAAVPRPAATSRPARCAGRRATIVGTSRRDVIRGTRRADVIAALGGNDVVRGLAGGDLICLGAGADRAFGGPGDDRIVGGAGRDRVLGGRGADRCAAERRSAC